MNQKSKLRSYIDKSVRRIKHRKGFGVHSPFAFGIITEVIEEKLPYYAYQQMQRTYPKSGPMPFKVACLLLRLANRFKARRIVEIGCDGGYSLLPLLLVDSRNRLQSVATEQAEKSARQHLSWFKKMLDRVSFCRSIDALDVSSPIDMIVVNSLPAETTPEQFCSWIKENLDKEGVIFVHGIQPGHPLERYWDMLAEQDDIQVTMDLYDYGLAIRRSHFFKQHYTVSF